MKIKMLNSDTINKIAAGEVIVRPVSVIKELVENSIDAGSTRITIEIEAGGKNYLTVRDNGCGIAYQEVSLAFKRHATSKLIVIDDLETIDSLGFRGEALSSVAAVSRVEITTRFETEEIGSITRLEAGKFINQRVASYGKGTEIKVWDLFFNTPARRKHLEKEKKEERLIRELVEKLALSNPTISFVFTSNQRQIFNTPGSGKVLDVIATFYGQDVTSKLIAVNYENQPMKITGFIGDLSMMRNHRMDQLFFMNARYIKSLSLSQSFDDAYDGYTMMHKHPFGILFIELPGRMLDINIHPAKTEIKILNESLVLLLFKQGIRETLKNANLVVDIGNITDKKSSEMNHEKVMMNDQPPNGVASQLKNESVTLLETASQEQMMLKEYSEPSYDEACKPEIIIKDHLSQVEPMIKEKPTITITKENNGIYENCEIKSNRKIERPDFTKMKIIGQLFNTYLLLEGDKVIFLIDQHAAHEAFLTQQLMTIFNKNEKMVRQGLLVPIPLKIRPKDMQRIKQSLEMYEALGYDCDIFGEESLMIRSVPVLMGEPQTSQWLNELISNESMVFEGNEMHTVKNRDKIIQMACKAAIKGGQDLTIIEIKQLLKDLMSLDNPFTCPHGRPIISKLREYELMKLFKRVV
jgi:DNA mismatch repair protein MutL